MWVNRVLLLLIIIVMLTVLVAREPESPARSGALPMPTDQDSPIQDAPNTWILDVRELPQKGSKNARIAIVEFSDYECPFCARHAAGVFTALDQQFIKTGAAIYVFANLPLPTHANAKFYARAAVCAGSQGQYWAMHDALFARPELSISIVNQLAADIVADSTAFQGCLDDPESERPIERDLLTAQAFGFDATPTFAIGSIEAGIVNIRKVIRGAQPMAAFEYAIETVQSNITER